MIHCWRCFHRTRSKTVDDAFVVLILIPCNMRIGDMTSKEMHSDGVDFDRPVKISEQRVLSTARLDPVISS